MLVFALGWWDVHIAGMQTQYNFEGWKFLLYQYIMNKTKWHSPTYNAQFTLNYSVQIYYLMTINIVVNYNQSSHRPFELFAVRHEAVRVTPSMNMFLSLRYTFPNRWGEVWSRNLVLTAFWSKAIASKNTLLSVTVARKQPNPEMYICVGMLNGSTWSNM